MRADAPEPLIFTAWVREAVRGHLPRRSGRRLRRATSTRARSALIRLLEGRATGRDWCDDRATPARETLRRRARRARSTPALDDLEQRYGADRVEMALGHGALRARRAPPVRLACRASAAFFNVEVPSPGGDYTLNRGKMDFGEEPPFANRHASSYRAIYDFADLERSLYMHTTGQSGNPFSPFYRSFAERWAKVEYIEIATKREDIAKAAHRHLEADAAVARRLCLRQSAG